MEATLKEINAVMGVIGSFVCVADGSVMAKAMPADFDDARLDAAARVACQTLNALEASGQRIAEADLLFGRGRLMLKNLRGGVLVILCARNINVPLLNLTANLAAKKIAAEFKPKKTVERVAAPPPPAPAPGVAAPVVEVAPSPPQAPAVEVAPSALLAELEQEMQRILAAARQARVTLRALDPLAMWLRCPKTRAYIAPPEKRQMDFAGVAAQSDALKTLFVECGYQGNRRFNAFYGDRRLNFTDAKRDLDVDVYLDAFEMYHRFVLTPMLMGEEIAVSATALALQRLQLVEMTDAGLRDLCALLLEYDLSVGPGEAKIDAAYITNLCADDWGWFRTVSMNLKRLVSFAGTGLSPSEQAVVVARAQRLLQSIEDAPKSLRWQARSRLSDTVQWHTTPLDPHSAVRPDMAIG